MNFSQQIKSRIPFYLIVGLLSGVLLWAIESIERCFTLHNYFIQIGERYLFCSYLVATTLGSILWGMFLIMCSTTRLATFHLVNNKPITLGSYVIDGKWKQKFFSFLALLFVLILLRITIHDYFTLPLYNIATGLTESFSYLNAFFKYSQTAVVFILLVLAFSLTILTGVLEDLANLDLNKENPSLLKENSKIILGLTILASLVLPISYYLDANFMVTRRDLSFHVPLYLLALLASFLLVALSYQWFISNKLGKLIVSVFVIITLGTTGVSIKYFQSNQNVKSLFWRHSVIAKRYGQLARKVTGQIHKDYIALLSTKPLSTNISSTLPTNLLAQPVNNEPVKTIDPNQRRNIIFLSIDTLRADHMGIYGYSRNITPNLDKFAKQSIFCERKEIH
jgi:hypothetical protein